MQTSLKTAITLFVSIPAVLIYYTVAKNSSNPAISNAVFLQPMAKNYIGLITLALLPSLCVGLTMAQNKKSDSGSFVPVLVLTTLLLLLLFYNIFSSKNSTVSKILLFAITVTVLVGWVWESTNDPYKSIIIGLMLSAFFIYAIIYKSTDLFNRFKDFSTNGWVVYFLLSASLISELMLIVSVYSNEERATSDEVFTWIALALIIAFTIYSFLSK